MATDALAALVGCPLTVVFSSLASFDAPVVQIDAVLRTIAQGKLTLELQSGLMAVGPHTRFGIFAQGKLGLVKFQATLAEPYSIGSRILTLTLPDKVDTIHRRRFHRVSIGGGVTCHYNGTDIRGDHANLSAGGVGFQAPVAMELDAVVSVSFSAPPPERESFTNLPARVRRCIGKGAGSWLIGVQFTEHDLAQELALVKLVWRIEFRRQKDRAEAT